MPHLVRKNNLRVADERFPKMRGASCGQLHSVLGGFSYTPSSLARFAASLASVTVISKTTGWPSVMRDRWLLGNLASSDNSNRCMTVSIRRR